MLNGLRREKKPQNKVSYLAPNLDKNEPIKPRCSFCVFVKQSFVFYFALDLRNSSKQLLERRALCFSVLWFATFLVSVFPPLAIDFWFLARIQVFFLDLRRKKRNFCSF